MDLDRFQDVIRRTYHERDAARGIDGTFRWMVEEVGELASALRRGGHDEKLHEVGDVLAWLASVAALSGVSLREAAERYANGCPACGHCPCACEPREPAREGPR